MVLLLNYCLNSGETRNIEEFVDTIQKGLLSDVGEKVMSIAEQLIQRGIERGKQEGILEGIVKGEAEGIAKGELLARRKLAQEALAENLPLVTIQKITGLTDEEIRKLQSEIKH